MQFKTLVFVAVPVMAAAALHIRQDDQPQPQIFTGERVFHTIIDKSPFFVESTTTFIWTQTPTATPTAAK
ncbi:hypothetical protein NLJ89_g9749 [Agrocybe chaxingu]|uniref:Uncharacterized protein n=1 Tax=Agrocybe chaxingu TaxID=84603 RepID=A0A9W8JZE9_9AGAR|nr:hypothetical protein NLJ89_g9749 [Agrocybe chaxingu]